jgi:hypothetical protein
MWLGVTFSAQFAADASTPAAGRTFLGVTERRDETVTAEAVPKARDSGLPDAARRRENVRRPGDPVSLDGAAGRAQVREA